MNIGGEIEYTHAVCKSTEYLTGGGGLFFFSFGGNYSFIYFIFLFRRSC